MTKATMTPLDEIKWDPKIYPRDRWSPPTIERYAEALEAGDVFPPIVVEDNADDPEADGRLLDGKHRLDAHRKAERTEIAAERHKIPEGMSALYYAATLSSRHGDRISNAELEKIAVADFEQDPDQSAAAWGKGLGISARSVQRWVKHITEGRKRSRQDTAARLTRLGWTQAEIGALLDVDRSLVSLDVKERQMSLSHIDDDWSPKWLEQESTRLGIDPLMMWAAALDGLDDAKRMTQLGIKVQPYDVWNFAGCHDLMGDAHPGRIPGELVCHALYFLTKPGDLVVDPMAGSGTTLDACLLMGRKARGYDIDHRHERVDVEGHDLSTGWPDTVGKARLVFWDPPYFDKMDHSTIGGDGYVEGSISGLDPDGYLDWLTKRFEELHGAVAPGTQLAFLMSDWDPENAKDHGEHAGIFQWDYADRLRDSGWKLTRQIQCPLGTQQVHPDIVNKFRASRRLARLGRYLLVAEK